MGRSMTGLELEGDGDDWRLHLSGDWSLAAIAQIEVELGRLPGSLHGKLLCDWSRAEAPGIGSVWVLLLRLAKFGAERLDIHHIGDPPHTLELLQKLEADQPPAVATRHVKPNFEGAVGRLGRWSIFQGTQARSVVAFLGRIFVVFGRAFSRPQAL